MPFDRFRPPPAARSPRGRLIASALGLCLIAAAGSASGQVAGTPVPPTTASQPPADTPSESAP
ncbi:MAG: hypothetical protein EBR82_41835, partial [Caulobacteraceae bacterium]|nr:hypothetical protein [Caulobacteraceae bacterium]